MFIIFEYFLHKLDTISVILNFDIELTIIIS